MNQATRLQHTDEVPAEPARHGDTRTWEPGTVDVSEADVADCRHLVNSGALRAVVGGEGGPSVTLDTLRAVECFGALMPSGERRAAALEVTSRARLTGRTRRTRRTHVTRAQRT